MASKGTTSGKSWKRKAMYNAKAAQARAVKHARMHSNQPDFSTEAGEYTVDDSPGQTGRSGGRSRGLQSTLEERAGVSGGDNEIGEGSSSDSDDSEFDDDKAQELFDEWIVSLSIQDRKMLAVLLFHSFRTRHKMTIQGAAREAGSIVGFNEKTVRTYNKDFYKNKGKFKASQQGKYKRK